MFSSPLSTQTGKVIDFLVFKDNKNQKVSLNMSGDNNTSIGVSVENLNSGHYYGWLYLTNGSSLTIPISISTEPKVIQAMILVVIGVLLSIIFWEIFFYFNKRFHICTRKKILRNIGLNDNYDALTIAQKNQDEQVKKKTARIEKVRKRYVEENAIKIASFEVASVVFGIVAGLVGALTDSYVTSSIEITPLIAATLIGTGLGIGSLKGLVDN